MDNSLESDFLKSRLLPEEKVIYQVPRNWLKVLEIVANVLVALLMGAAYVLLSGWQQNIITFATLSTVYTLSDVYLVQGLGIVRLALLILAAYILLFSLIQLLVLFLAKAVLTDRRVLGKTGRNILRTFDIPLDRIAWVDFPNHVFSKGPINIHTKDGKNTILWNLASPGTFLGYLETSYTPENVPVIHKQTMWGQVVLFVVVGLALAFLIVSAFFIYTT